MNPDGITNGWDRICRPVRAVTIGPFFALARGRRVTMVGC